MLQKYGKRQEKSEEEFPVGYESKIEMKTGTLSKYLNENEGIAIIGSH